MKICPCKVAVAFFMLIVLSSLFLAIYGSITVYDKTSPTYTVLEKVD